MTTPPHKFGCSSCWPKAADEAWHAAKHLKTEIELVDESHFMIKIRSCNQCSQQFVSVFTETVDWTDGEDLQYWTVMPITTAEFSQLLSNTHSAEVAILGLPRERASLCHEPTNYGGPQSYWSQGIIIGPHD